MKKLLIVFILFAGSTAFGGQDKGQTYVDNNTSRALYVQFLFRKSDLSDSDKYECRDSKDDYLHEVLPYQTVSDDYSVYAGGADCHFTLNVFEKPESGNSSLKPVTLRMVAQEYGVWSGSSNGGAGVKLVSHDTPPRVCALGYSCSTNRTDGGNHLHLIMSKGNKYSPITFKNDSPDVLYVNYDKKSGKCSDNVDIDYQKVLPGGSFTDQIRSTHKGEQCYYEMNVATDKKGLNRVSTKEVVVSDNNNDETYLLSQRSIYSIVDFVVSSSEERMYGVMYGVTYTAKKR